MPFLGRFSYRIYRLFWSGLDWLYPPSCGGCGSQGELWCVECDQKARRIEPPICPLCGRPQSSSSICNACCRSNPDCDAVRSWAVYDGPVRNALHRLKYKRDIALGVFFAQYLIMSFDHISWDIDIITSVPLGIARLRERGYNQSALLAYPLSLALHKPYRSRVLWRTRETRSQVELGAEERKKNVSEAFSARPDAVGGKCVLVVDDITTTGATLNACAAALKKAGARKVYGLTLAKAVLEEN